MSCFYTERDEFVETLDRSGFGIHISITITNKKFWLIRNMAKQRV